MLNVKTFQFNPFMENTYVIYNEFNDCIIIDPGCYGDDEEQQLTDFIEAKKLKPVQLLNTHCHLDHVFGNKFVAEKYGLPLHIHAGEQVVLDYAPTAGLMYGVPFDNYVGKCVYLSETEEVVLGKDVFKLLLMPGHSPASIGFYHASQGFVISGDVLFNGSIGRTDLPGGDYETLIKSIKENLLKLPDETVVYSGHGPETTVGYERRNNPFLVD